jgi:cytochrome c-type biogenesis protein CcmH/NrfG
MGRGTVSERPWGLTLASAAEACRSGQLTLTADDGKLYGIAFEGGAIVGASSPLASDAAARVALTSQLVTPAQVPELARAAAEAPGRDEVAIVAAAAGLSGAQTAQLRRQVLMQRVARTFAVERGGYVLGDRVTVATVPGIAVEVGPAIFFGVRRYLAEDRLAEDLRRLGARFVLRTEELDGARFGFTEHERPILAALRVGTSLPELEARWRELEPRVVQAVIYTLVATGLCEGLPPARSRELSRPPTMLAPEPEPELPPDEDDEEDALCRARTTTFRPLRRPAQMQEPAPTPAPAPAEQEQPRTRTISSLPPSIYSQVDAEEVRETIASGIARLEARVDHFALLGLPRDATVDSLRAAYVALASRLNPEKMPEELEPSAAYDAQRLLARVSTAYGVLSDPVRRAEYLAELDRITPAQGPASGTAVERARAAAELVQRGMHALRREDLGGAVALLARATELAPQDPDFAARLAWARFCAAADKAAIAGDVRRVLHRAIARSSRPAMARFYLGRVERVLGRVREALNHFHEVLRLDPSHAEAAAEVRLLEPRAARR